MLRISLLGRGSVVALVAVHSVTTEALGPGPVSLDDLEGHGKDGLDGLGAHFGVLGVLLAHAVLQHGDGVQDG